ncbi:hypothetical protein BS17DRAFT_778523 [Gyrodon lividus]|nr:hypothetical protein BS17DRAFT_778523 [Gyrodon lividus]
MPAYSTVLILYPSAGIACHCAATQGTEHSGPQPHQPNSKDVPAARELILLCSLHHWYTKNRSPGEQLQRMLFQSPIFIDITFHDFHISVTIISDLPTCGPCHPVDGIYVFIYIKDVGSLPELSSPRMPNYPSHTRSMEPTHNRQGLNNHLQAVWRNTRRLTWEKSHDGPGHRPTWLAIAYLDGIEWGRGEGPSCGAATEAAAANVLNALGVE